MEQLAAVGKKSTWNTKNARVSIVLRVGSGEAGLLKMQSQSMSGSESGARSYKGGKFCGAGWENLDRYSR